jgi:hypothetical protein
VHRLGRPSARGPAPVCSQCVEDETANIAVPGNPAFPASLSVEWRAYGDVRPTENGAVYSRFGSISPVPARSRGRPAADLEALEDALMRVSYLAHGSPARRVDAANELDPGWREPSQGQRSRLPPADLGSA